MFNISHFEGGYNVSCHGGADGTIEAIAVGNNGPFFYAWSNGATTARIQNLHAGVYTVIVTDFANNTFTNQVELLQPDAMTVQLTAREFEGGTNISELGAADGEISSFISGGTPPYTYLWSNIAIEPNLSGLLKGIYSLTVTDATNCIANATVTLTEPSQLSISSITSPLHGGYNLLCNESHDGVINLNVTGGIPPYRFLWNNGSFDQNQQHLDAGHYMVRVFDANEAEVDGQITLTQPNELSLSFTKSQFQGNYNISCYSCANGNLQANVTGGVAPYSYSWGTLQTTQTISNLSAGLFGVHVFDANGCIVSSEASMLQPDREDWTMGGNANTNPATQFIGTSDSVSLSFRTNNSERLKLLSDGSILLNGLTSPGLGIVTIDANGKLIKTGLDPLLCESSSTVGLWSSDALKLYTCDPRQVIIGSDNIPTNIRFKVNGSTILDGVVGIGINPLTVSLQSGATPYKLFVNGKMGAKEIYCSNGTPWPDYVFNKNYSLLPIAELKTYIEEQQHLPGIPSATEIEKGGMNMGELLTSSYQKIEDLTLYIIQLESRITAIENSKSKKRK